MPKGLQGFQKGHRSFHTEESKRKIGEASKGNSYRLGIKHSLEVRKKISLALKGKPDWKKGLKFPERGGENAYQWKGDKVGYQALHIWVRKCLGVPDTCEFCGKTGLTGRRINWANKSQEYKRNLTDWIRLCAKCHQAYDRKQLVLV